MAMNFRKPSSSLFPSAGEEGFDFRNFFGGRTSKAGVNYQNSLTEQNNLGLSNILAQGQKAYDPANIAQYYNMAQGNLNRQAGNTGAYIGRQAGAQATNMLNPSSFILGNISKSQEPYAEAGQQLQASGAQAQQTGAADLTNLMYLINRAKQGDTQAAAELEYKYAALKAQQDANEAGVEDYLGLGANFVTGMWGKK
jgi:hypothetical protein